MQEVLKTKTLENKSQANHREVLPSAIQRIKPQRFMYFKICYTANFDLYHKQNLIHFGVKHILGW